MIPFSAYRAQLASPCFPLDISSRLFSSTICLSKMGTFPRRRTETFSKGYVTEIDRSGNRLVFR